MYSMDILNGGHLSNQPAFPGQAYGGNKINYDKFEQVDPSTYDDDSDDDDFRSNRPGKKTKGRVKIKMEFIENKLRRYTTFSKRKTGIMKKAYELSTLTGTQVMLLVASETGHVYTFATRKLQPMITSESGKALIQTCLNSPDPPPMAPGQQQAVEQRMNPGGFEETELTYAVDEENGKLLTLENNNGGLKPVYTLQSAHSSSSGSPVPQPTPVSLAPSAQPIQTPGQTYQISTTPQPTSVGLTTVQPVAVASSPQSSSTTKSSTPTPSGISLQFPQLPPGFILQPAGTSFIPVQGSTQPSISQPAATGQSQTVYRIPTQSQVITNIATPDTSQKSSTSSGSPSAATVNVIPTASGAAAAMTPSVFMYQTPQGIVYAPATGSLQDKSIPVFNFAQPNAAALSLSQDGTGGSQQQQQQQIITIPVPVSMGNSPQVLQFSPTDTGQVVELTQPTPAKKSRK